MNKKMKMIFLDVAGICMSCGNIAGLNPVGLAFMAALYGSGLSGVLSIGTLVVGMVFTFEFVTIIKYMMVLSAVVLISKLITFSTSKLSEYAIGFITFLSMLAIEFGDIFMSNRVDGLMANENGTYLLMKPILSSMLAGGLVIIFYNGIQAFLKGKSMYENNELFSGAVIIGLIIFNLGQYVSDTEMMLVGSDILGINGIISNMILFFSILYGAYKYGALVGAIMGASGGIAFCILNNDARYLGIMCMIGILCGMFREVGRIITALSVVISNVVVGIAFFPLFISDDVMKGVLGAATIFVLLPATVIYRIEERENEDKTYEMQKLCEEKLLTTAKAIERLSGSISTKNMGIDGIRYQGNIGGGKEAAIHAIWQDKFDEGRKMVSGQLMSISKMIEDYSKDIYSFVGISAEEEENITHLLKTKKVYVEKIVGLESKRSKKEYLVTAKCQKGATIGTREVADVLSSVLGKELMPSKNCRKVLSQEYTTTSYVEKANFYVSHGAAKMARGVNGISGDNYSLRELENGQVLMGISDGMGYGASASMESETVIELLEQLLESGFDGKVALGMINSVMFLNNKDEHPATLDYGDRKSVV